MLRISVLFSFCFCILFQGVVIAQSTFLKTYGDNNSGYGTSLCATPDHGFAVASIIADGTTDINTVLFRTDRNGDKQWSKSYRVMEKNVPGKVINSGAGGFYLLFSTWTIFNPANFVTIVIRTDSTGNPFWTRSLSFSASDYAVDILLEGDHVYVISNSNYNNSGYPGILIHKLDTSGQLIWSHAYGGSYGVVPVSAALDGYGRLAVCGNTNSYGIGIPINSNNFLLIVDSAGNQIRTTVTGKFYSDEPKALVWQNGNWVFSSLGYTLINEYDISIQRFDSSGSFLASKLYDATIQFDEWEDARDILPLSDGSLILTGDLGKFEERNIFLAQLDPAGNIDWAVQYPVSPIFTNYAFEVVPTYEGGYAVTGDIRPPAYFRDAYILKTDSQGLIPCYTAPVNFTVSPDSLEILYLNFLDSAVQTSITSPVLMIDTPIYPEYLICENVPPDAMFSSTIDSVCPETCYEFTDQSSNDPQTWDWLFTGGQPSSYSGQQPPVVCYPAPGNYTVQLTVSNADGSSSYSMTLNIAKVKCDTLFIPNVITPNGDGKNDLFSIKGLPEKFRLRIFNRWGKLLFETESEKDLWNPEEVTDGVYYYFLQLYSSEGEEKMRGTVSVLGE